MKNLKKLKLKEVSLSKKEMQSVVGGKIIYHCLRIKPGDYYGDYVVGEFDAETQRLAATWANFWTAAGWTVSIEAKDDGSDTTSYSPYHYV